MATFQPRAEEDEFTADDWAEAVAAVDPSGQDVLSNESSDAPMTVLIDAAKMRSAMSWVLGYSYASDSPGDLGLHRVVAAAHPIYGPQFRATRVGFTRFAPKGNTLNPDNEPYQPSVFAGGNGYVDYYANYQKVWMTVTFSQTAAVILEDDDPSWDGNEWSRYTVLDVVPSLDVLTADPNRMMSFVESNGTTGPPNSPVGTTKFPGQVALYLPKALFVLTWYEVPRTFLFNAQNVPQKLVNATGTVNSADFMGVPAHCLLMDAPEFTRHQFPFHSDDGPALHYTVRVPLKFFNPPPGAASPLSRGHQLLPWRVDGKWYYATRDGIDGTTSGTGGTPLFPETDFADIFKHVLS